MSDLSPVQADTGPAGASTGHEFLCSQNPPRSFTTRVRLYREPLVRLMAVWASGQRQASRNDPSGSGLVALAPSGSRPRSANPGACPAVRGLRRCLAQPSLSIEEPEVCLELSCLSVFNEFHTRAHREIRSGVSASFSDPVRAQGFVLCA